jgi:hypothetical protein
VEDPAADAADAAAAAAEAMLFPPPPPPPPPQQQQQQQPLREGRKGKYNERSFPVLLDLIAASLMVADRSVTVKHSNGRLSSRVCRAYLPCHYRSLRPGKSVSRRAPAAAAAPLAAAAVPVAAATAEVTGAAAAAAAAVGTGLVDEMEQ